MPIRVLHIIGSLRLGGAQTCLKQIVEHNDNPDIEHYIYPLRSRHIDIPVAGNVITLDYPNYDPRKFFAIFSLCKKYNIDIIHAHLHKPIIGALLTRFFMKVPVIVHEHCTIAYQGLQYSLYRSLLRFLKGKAHTYIAVSQATKHDLYQRANVNPSKIQVIYNAVDLDTFSPNPEKRKEMRKEFNIGMEDFVLGFVGRLAAVKGPELILDALDLLLKNKSNCTAVFLGHGPQKESLIKQAAKLNIKHRTRFLDFRDDVSDVLNIFDAAIMPSRKEGLPLTALEYMSMKIPLVSSGVDGLGEILEDRHNALILKENTARCILECICEIQNDNQLVQTLVNNAHHDVQNFSIPHFIHQINGIYLEAAKIA